MKIVFEWDKKNDDMKVGYGFDYSKAKPNRFVNIAKEKVILYQINEDAAKNIQYHASPPLLKNSYVGQAATSNQQPKTPPSLKYSFVGQAAPSPSAFSESRQPEIYTLDIYS